jgi:hypothetical protein
MKNTRCIHPQDVYGVTRGETCRGCRFCQIRLPYRVTYYCTRFYREEENPKSRISAYDQACGKFERKDEA